MKKILAGSLCVLLLGAAWAHAQGPFPGWPGMQPGYGPPMPPMGMAPPPMWMPPHPFYPPPGAWPVPQPMWPSPPPSMCPGGCPQPPPNFAYPQPAPYWATPMAEGGGREQPGAPDANGETRNDAAASPSPRPAAEPQSGAQPAASLLGDLKGGNGLFCCERDPPPCWHSWIMTEALYWVPKSQTTPPLVTKTTDPTQAGAALGVAGTSTLFGGNVGYGGMYGTRLTAGTWLDPDRRWGVEGSAFIFETDVVDYTLSANTNQVVSVPIFKQNFGSEGFFIVSNAVNPAFGTANIQLSSQLYGGEVSGLFNVLRSRGWTMDLLGGVRYQNLSEGFALQDNLTQFGTFLSLNDSFQTTNRFVGGQLGLRTQYRWKQLFVNATLKAALGANLETVAINGYASSSLGVTTPGGIFAQPTNIGTQSQTAFSAIPQLQLQLGWDMTPNLRLFVGYDFMGWLNVVRAADQIDRNINLSQLPISEGGSGMLIGVAAPARGFNQSTYYAQGLSLGVMFKW